jgi:hypothetical protein
MAEHFGLDPREYTGPQNPEDFTDWMESKLRDSRAQGDEYDEEDVEGDYSTGAARTGDERQAETAVEAKKLLTKLYRRLVSFLHPDRPTDETKAERDHKEDLFKRAGAARDEGDMLTLLGIELELGLAARGVKRIGDTAHLAQEHLDAYLHLLDTQAKTVKSLIAQILQRVGLDPDARKAQLTPAAAEQTLNTKIAVVQEALDSLNAQIASLLDPKIMAYALERLWEASVASYNHEYYPDERGDHTPFDYSPAPSRRRR